MYSISQLFIFPIKSLGGFEVSSAYITDRGLQFDRRWMLVDECNVFLSQRNCPQMCLFQTAIQNNQLVVYSKNNIQDQLLLDLHPVSFEFCKVKVWEDVCEVIFVSDKADQWFSEKLAKACRLVFMPDSEKRQVDSLYAHKNELTSFSDGYPILMIGQASLDDLNSRLKQPLSWDRFRPNIVFTGGLPYDEDTMEHIRINSMRFYGVKLCSRCIITSIDQNTAVKGKEPNQTLAAYRTINNNIYFGQNMLLQTPGVVEVGNKIEIINKTEPFIFQKNG